jgi:hypothetical protein
MTRLARMITEIRLRDDTRPSDFRVPLPGSKEAFVQDCTCPAQPEWPNIAFASDCPLHVTNETVVSKKKVSGTIQIRVDDINSLRCEALLAYCGALHYKYEIQSDKKT